MPVRNIAEDEKTAIEKYVVELESQGHEVYYPLRNTNQNDNVGLRICGDNVKAMFEADSIHFWWSDKSQGSIFDMGAVFALITCVADKKIVIANASDIKPTEHKSFTNVLIALSKGERPAENLKPSFSTIVTYADLERSFRHQQTLK